jgi:hypothetical protein
MRLLHRRARPARSYRARSAGVTLAATEALDDAGAALTIARACGYAWAERDALQLKADALVAQGDRDAADAARREAEAMTRRLLGPRSLERSAGSARCTSR